MKAIAPKSTAKPMSKSWKSVNMSEKKIIDKTPQNWIILLESLFNTNKFGNWILKYLKPNAQIIKQPRLKNKKIII